MLTLDRVIIGVALAALAFLLFPMFGRRVVTAVNVEATKGVLDSIVGASPVLGENPVGIAIMVANSPWMFPPPLGLMLPVTGAAAAPSAQSYYNVADCQNGC